MQPSEVIWMNGEFVGWEDAKVHVLTHALHYGTARLRGRALLRHRDRAGGLPPPGPRRAPVPLVGALLHAGPVRARADPPGDARADRPQRAALLLHPPARLPRLRHDGPVPARRAVDVAIAVWEWGAYLGEEGKRDGIRAKVSSWRRISPDSLIPHAKAGGQYLNSVLAKIETHKAGYDEAILLDDHGHVCEGSGENIYVVRDGVVYTPPQTASILDGINRKHGDPDRPRPRHRGRRARHRARRALHGRRGLHERHRGRARPGARDRRPPRSATASPARSRARSRRPSTTRCTGAPSATASGSTRCRCGAARRAARERAGRALRRHPPRRDGRRRHEPHRGGEAARRPPPRRARRPPDRGRLPGVEPQGAGALRAARGRAPRRRSEIVAFGMTRRRERRGRRRTRACACSPTASRRSARSSARRSLLHVEKVVRVSREENLAMIAESIAFLVGEGKRVLLDAEHFFDGFAHDPRLRARLRARGGRRRRRARRALRHQRRLAALADQRGGRAPCARRCRTSRSGSTRHDDSRLRGRQHARRRRGRRDAGAGHDQRHRRAHRQREPRHDHRRPAAEDGHRRCSRPSSSRG